MTARANEHALVGLRNVSDQMSVPLPRRTELLSELRADLDALTDRLIAEGASREDAQRRATEALVPDEETLDRLEGLHASGYQRLVAGLGDAGLRRFERTALAIAMAVVVVSGGGLLLQVGVLQDASTFLWPVLVMGSALAAVCLAKAFQLWIKGDHTAPRRGLWGVPFLAGGTLLVGGAGMLSDTILLLATLEGTPGLAADLLVVGLVRETTLLATALLIAMAGAAFWLVANQWITLAEDAHQRALGINSTPSFKEK
jgi:hypothetical protein